MSRVQYQDLLQAGVHFGHMRKKWNPKMRQYIFAERKGVHIIDLNRTIECIDDAASAARSIAKSGRKILFVATKKQARDIVTEAAKSVNMPYVTDRWLGGMMTNFSTIRRSIKKMQSIEQMLADTTLTSITKKERLTLEREKIKLNRVLGGIANLNRLPAAMFVVDITHEHLAVTEAQKLNIKTIAMVDTNSNPNLVDFPIPANDDASKSVAVITEIMVNAVKEGLEDRKKAKAELETTS